MGKRKRKDKDPDKIRRKIRRLEERLYRRNMEDDDSKWILIIGFIFFAQCTLHVRSA